MTNWKRQIKIKQYLREEDPIEVVRDNVVTVLRRQPEYKVGRARYDEDFELLVDEMAEVDSIHYFNLCLNALYDWADANRIWIGGDLPSRLPSV